MDKEISSFVKLGTYKLVPRLKDTPVLLGRWIFKIKKRLNKSIFYKAR